MADVVSAAASAGAVEVYKDMRNAVASIDQVRDYERRLDKNSEKLKDEAKKLYARKVDFLAKKNRDRTKQTTEECNLWIGMAKKLEKDVQALLTEYEEEKKHQFSLVRFLHRSDLSKRIVEKCIELQSCWLEGSSFATDVMVERSTRPIIKAKAPKIEDKPILYDVFEEILEFLSMENVRRIGLWGRVGVGKTAIMQNLNENEKVSKLFDVVFFVTLSDEGDENKLQEKIQCQIAQELEVNLEGFTDTKKIASIISEKLESTRYLLLLDDVWGAFDLDDVGIYDKEDSKVVIASRHRGICREMCVDHIINVPRLSDDDAWILFEERLGRKLNSDFKPLALQVIKECDNLPLLIDKVARAFRRKDEILLWEAGLNKLRIWPNVKCDGMDDLFDLLRFCYEELDEDEKICFLYGALFSEGCEIYINYMLECWRAEGFTQDVEQFTALQKGQEILHDLMDASLLEYSEKVKHVRMNKVLRKMAFKISSENEDSKWLVEAGKGIQKAPESEEWKQKVRISLMDNKLCTLPESTDCSKLSTLFLQRNVDLAVIPPLFFEYMQSLRVLDLQGTNITKLPSSFSCLVHLRALYLNSCRKLLKLPSKIKVLKLLEVVDIRNTMINTLPDEIEYLGKLRCLRMSLSKIDVEWRKIKTKNSVSIKIDGKWRKIKIKHAAISKLSSLEELIIDIHPENPWWNPVVRDIVENASVLTNLTHLSFSIGQYHSTRYKILDYFGRKICKVLKYASGAGNLEVPEVLAEADAFELIGHKGEVKLSDFGIDNLAKIKSCLIESCTEMKTLIDNNGVRTNLFECLEKLYLSNAPKLENIWEGPVPSRSLVRLNTLVFFKCSKLKRILSCNLIEQFCELQHLEIEACHEIEEITMEAANNRTNVGILPSLKTLTLVGLPSLKTIWIDDSLDWSSLNKKIVMCPLFDSQPSRRTIQ